MHACMHLNIHMMLYAVQQHKHSFNDLKELLLSERDSLSLDGSDPLSKESTEGLAFGIVDRVDIAIVNSDARIVAVKLHQSISRYKPSIQSFEERKI